MSERNRAQIVASHQASGRIAEVCTTASGEVVVLGRPDGDGEDHNCDASGCGMSHVLWRGRAPSVLSPADREALEHVRGLTADDRSHCDEVDCSNTACVRADRALAVLDRLLSQGGGK